MKAIHVQTEQEGRPLVWRETDDPTWGAEEVLVDVHAASLNRADLMQRAGGYPPPAGASDILGLDMAGRIAQVGAGVSGWQIGDRVCALLAGGGYAEKVAVPQQLLMPIPAGWSYEQAAAVPEVFMTAFVNLFMEAGFQAGETVLIHGGASGVGTAAIQLLREAGGRIAVTASTETKLATCRELGADLAIIDKRRELENISEVMNIIGDVNGRECMILDDMIDTAGTMTNAARALQEQGAKRVMAAATHPVLSGPALERIVDSPLEEVIVTDTIPLREEAIATGRFRVLSVAGLLGEAIKRIHHSDSVSSLFV